MSAATTTSNTSSTVPNANPKVSKLAVKAGFVIPKNRLSGSLVPIFKGAKKNDELREVDNKNDGNVSNDSKVQRKTKWGRDLTQDASVRKGRALAYQTRLDQIAQQLKLGSLEVEEIQDSEVAAENANHRSSKPQVVGEKLELLELEKREVIGEILKLNPSYKAPPDYKPLLKEAIVPIPVKEYPGYNFLGLIFGPASDTQRRLEKETGTTIKICGTKADTGEKVEVSTSDGNDQDTYEELYISISADAYEKVDVAVDLIELLITSVSGSLAAISSSTSVSVVNVTVLSQSQGEGTLFSVPNAVVNQDVAQQVVGTMQTPPQPQFQDNIPWFPLSRPQNPMHPLNSSAPILTSPMNVPSVFVPQPSTAAGFSSILQTPNLVPPPSLPMQVPPRPYMPQVHSGPPRNFPVPAPQPSSAPSTMSGLLSFPGFQTQPAGGPPAFWRQPLSSLPQAVANIPPRPLSDQLSSSAGSSSGWSGAPANAPAPFGSSNMGQFAPTMIPSQGPGPVISQPSVASGVPPKMSAANMVSPASFPSGAATIAMTPPAVPVVASGPASQVGSSPPFPLRPTQVSGSASTSMPPISRPVMPGGMSGPVSGSITNFSTVNPSSAITTRPHHPSSGDFTFQPLHPQNPAPTFPRPSTMLTSPHHRPMSQLPVPQVPSFHIAVPNAAPKPIMQVPRPRGGNQMVPPQAHISGVPFARNPNPAFANMSAVSPTTPSSQMGPRNFGPRPQVPYSAGPLPPRPTNAFPQNCPAPRNRPGNLIGLTQHLGSSGGAQVYDPFSPTSVSIPPQQQGANPGRVRKPENDPEYEDLMASVGVK